MNNKQSHTSVGVGEVLGIAEPDDNCAADFHVVVDIHP